MYRTMKKYNQVDFKFPRLSPQNKKKPLNMKQEKKKKTSTIYLEMLNI